MTRQAAKFQICWNVR